MLTRSQIDRTFALKAEAVTPLHAAAAAGLDARDADEAERRRQRVQHEADPYLHEDDLPEVAHADLSKAFNQAVDVPEGYPPMRPVRAEEFRRGPLTAGQEAYSPGNGPPGQAMPIPSATLAAGMITRPALTDGQSRPCAPEAC